jgi:voltage-gated potassium channel Kch
VIAFGTDVFSSFSQIAAATHQVGANVVIAVSPTDTITLTNVAIANIGADDFRFV